MSVNTIVHRAVENRPFLTIFRYNLPYWRAYTGSVVIGFAFLAVGLALPLVFRAIVASLEAGTMTRDSMWNYFYLLLAIAAGSAVARYWQRTLIGRASRKFEFDLRNDYFRHVQGLSQEFFHRTKTGDIMARATNDLNFVRMVIRDGLLVAVDLFRVPISMGLFLYLSVKLTAVVVLAVPITSLLSYFILKYTRKQTVIVQERFSDLTSLAQENLAGARVVKAYDASERETEAFRKVSDLYARDNLKLVAFRGLMLPMMITAIRLTLVVLVLLGGFMVLRHEPTSRVVIEDGWLAVQTTEFKLADLMGFVTGLMMLSGSLAAFGMVATIYQQGAAGMNRISEILTETPAVSDGEDTDASIAALGGGVRFDNVTFKYGSAPVLRNVSFEIRPGETVAVVGPTGSGKSTVLSLMTRQYDPTEGEVLFDGVDARRIPLDALRSSTGLVPQDTFLFSDTIRANLIMGRPEASEEEILEACRIAQFEETLAGMEKGLETLLGERGVNLSGGQKQRLTIARALIQDPAILLLDDALASVDTRTEELILQGLKDVMAARTSVIVSHRVSTVRHADLILVLDDGEIVERGTHDDLIAEGGLYTGMHLRQTLEEELEDE